MITLSIVLGCIVAHLACARFTRGWAFADDTDGGLTAVCLFLWPFVLAWRLVHTAVDKNEAVLSKWQAAHKKLEEANMELREKLAEATKKPPAQGVHR